MILERASAATGYSIAEITGRCRLRHVSWVRLAVIAELRAKGLSLPSIGRLLRRHHTTILFGLRQVEALRDHPEFNEIRSAIA